MSHCPSERTKPIHWLAESHAAFRCQAAFLFDIIIAFPVSSLVLRTFFMLEHWAGGPETHAGWTCVVPVYTK